MVDGSRGLLVSEVGRGRRRLLPLSNPKQALNLIPVGGRSSLCL